MSFRRQREPEDHLAGVSDETGTEPLTGGGVRDSATGDAHGRGHHEHLTAATRRNSSRLLGLQPGTVARRCQNRCREHREQQHFEQDEPPARRRQQVVGPRAGPTPRGAGCWRDLATAWSRARA